MYERSQYREDCSGEILATLKAGPLAMIVTGAGEQAPLATHAPVFFGYGPDGADEAAVAEGRAELVGSTLLGHMDVRNPQWTAMREGDRGLVVFQGPHGYISPVVYDVTPAAPTWNFTAVHVTGTLRPTDDRAEVLAILRETVRRLEGTFGKGWDQEDSQDYFRRIQPGVGAFELRVESVQTMYKLSQEQPEPLQRKVVEEFGASESVTHRRLAAMMRDRGIGVDEPGTLV